ncbi:SIR2 family protein [Pilimelia columellifera]|uniref:SIR2-like domain-containing protein n=1 Tax=Pilimelia columellifera subsp. columellifera TaxID=706583 RepID=A0ABP6AF90_9ACTN
MSAPDGAAALVEHLVAAVRRGEHLTLLVGSGLTVPAVPGVAQMLALADEYAAGRDDRGELAQELGHARAASDDPAAVYRAYHRAFASWVSGNEFDVVAQEAVLQAYQPAERARSPLATHGVWQRVDTRLGERVEADQESWRLTDGVTALGRLLARRPAQFGNRVLTTNVDPLVEVAIRRAGGRATPMTLTDEGAVPSPAPAADAVRVFHLHGYWRPLRPADRHGLLHDPERLRRAARTHSAAIARLLRGDTIVVIGYGGWDDVFLHALKQVGHRVTVVWALHGDDPDTAAAHQERLAVELAGHRAPVVLPGVDADVAIPTLAERLGIPGQPRAPRTRRRWRQRVWERELLTEPHSAPPPTVPELLEQLDRRFGWELAPAGDGAVAPTTLFWPVRLRQSSSLIHAVQALAAAALAARGVAVTVCLDDFNVARRYQAAARFTADVRRWFSLVPGAAEPTVVSLQDQLDGPIDPGAPRLAPTRPWPVARQAYGDRNPSLYSVLVATKVLPNIPVERLADQGATVVQALLSKNANRLLTPLTVWAHLNEVIAGRPPETLLTLSGQDERPFWQLWREIFDCELNHLFNPLAENLTNDSLMLRWSQPRELADHLARARQLPDWDTPHGYLHWLTQNAVLLPRYLTGGPTVMIGGRTLDSWAAVAASAHEDPALLSIVADLVSGLYLPRG